MGRARLKAVRPPLPRYVVEYEVPKGSGKWFVYFRRKGMKDIRMRGTPGTDEWEEQYRRLLAGERPEEKTGPDVIQDGTLGWLVEQYYRSADFMDLDERTRRVRRSILGHCLSSTPTPTASQFRDIPLARFTPKSVAILRDQKGGMPEAANGRVKAIRSVFNWAGKPEVGIVNNNPAREVQYRMSNNPDGHHTWTIDEVERFEERHQVGTKARLALALLLYTGQRRSDVVLFGRQHERNGWLRFTQQKNKRNNPIHLEIPIRPELREVLDASPVGEMVYLVTEFNKPFTANGFGNWFRDRCVEAGVPGRAHGLRKAAATRLADRGATAHEIMAITGHKTLKEVDRYTRAANQRRLAEQASER